MAKKGKKKRGKKKRLIAAPTQADDDDDDDDDVIISLRSSHPMERVFSLAVSVVEGLDACSFLRLGATSRAAAEYTRAAHFDLAFWQKLCAHDKVCRAEPTASWRESYRLSRTGEVRAYPMHAPMERSLHLKISGRMWIGPATPLLMVAKWEPPTRDRDRKRADMRAIEAAVIADAEIVRASYDSDPPSGQEYCGVDYVHDACGEVGEAAAIVTCFGARTLVFGRTEPTPCYSSLTVNLQLECLAFPYVYASLADMPCQPSSVYYRECGWTSDTSISRASDTATSYHIFQTYAAVAEEAFVERMGGVGRADSNFFFGGGDVESFCHTFGLWTHPLTRGFVRHSTRSGNTLLHIGDRPASHHRYPFEDEDFRAGHNDEDGHGFGSLILTLADETEGDS
jgi:hypothetical protein